ncbi:TPA: phage terminase small subunit P27 family, partial [Klebsiella variicola]
MAGGIRSSGGGRKPTLPTGQKSKLTRIAPPAELMGEAAI